MVEDVGSWKEETMEAELSRLAASLNNPGINIDLLSDISIDARLPLARMLLKAKIRRCDDIEFVVNRYLRLGVSINRAGRHESVNILEKVLIGVKEMIQSLRTSIRENL